MAVRHNHPTVISQKLELASMLFSEPTALRSPV